MRKRERQQVLDVLTDIRDRLPLPQQHDLAEPPADNSDWEMDTISDGRPHRRKRKRDVNGL